MTPKCDLCGEFESGNMAIHPDFNACYGCLTDLIDSEIDRRQTEKQERDFLLHWEGRVTQDDRDRQDLKDAGRGHLT